MKVKKKVMTYFSMFFNAKVTFLMTQYMPDTWDVF